MESIFVNQVGYINSAKKKAVVNFDAKSFSVCSKDGKEVLTKSLKHFGKDDISGEDVYVADFSEINIEGTYFIKAGKAKSTCFEIGATCYDKLMKDLCKCFYFLRCGTGLDEKYAGVYKHEPCHTSKAKVYGEENILIDVSGGWHDAGDYGRYTTAGAVAVAHLLYAVRFFPELKDVKFDIPKDGKLPDILAEVKVELEFLMKMQKEDGSAYHKVTTFCHADFIMPEEDKNDLFLFPVSSLATADIAAVFALAYTVYEEYDISFANRLLEAAKRAYSWLDANPQEVLFKNAPGSNTGEYGEAEDISNRYWAAASMYEATKDNTYMGDLLFQKERLALYEAESKHGINPGFLFSCLGWEDVAGLGSLSLLITEEDSRVKDSAKRVFKEEADRLVDVASKNGFGLCMEARDFIWGSNMELGKYLMLLTVANLYFPDKKYADTIQEGLDYLLGCNSMDTSYVTGNGEKAFKNPHLRPTAMDNIEDPWPGLVSGGPNRGLQDERAKEVDKNSAPMKCYLDHVDCYSLNEITIYWNSPFVFVLAALLR